MVAALRRRLPGESILYLGDTARLPYGTKSPTTVRRYTERNLDFLRDRGVKAVVVACNTASALALPQLTPQLPTWGVVEPGALWAERITQNRRVGVIATESTVRSDAYGTALRRLSPGIEVFSRSCPLFVPLVEEGWLDDEVVEAVARRYLEPLARQGVDTLVLGCTHYPLLKPVLRRVMGDQVRLADSAKIVADTVAAGLEEAGLLETHDEPEMRTCLTDASESFAGLARMILGDSWPAPEWVDV